MPRFAILLHVTPPGFRQPTHWDLMLEDRGELLTWALAEPPRAGLLITATQLPNHRLAYLDYEGAVSDDRGNVTRVVSGDFVWLSRDATLAVAVLTGQHATWRYELQQQAGTEWELRIADC